MVWTKESRVQIPLTVPLGAEVLLLCILSSIGKRSCDRQIPPPSRVLKKFQKLIPNTNTPEGTIHKCIKTKRTENIQFMLSYTPTSRHHSKEISSLTTHSSIYFPVSNFPSKMLCCSESPHTLETWRFRFVVKYDLFTKETECTENFCCIKFPQNRKWKHSDIRYNKHYHSEEELKKTQHFLFYFTVHNTLAFTLWHLNKVPRVLSRKMGFNLNGLPIMLHDTGWQLYMFSILHSATTVVL